MTPTFSDIEAAAQRVRPWVHKTPVLTSSFFDRALNARVFFKCENFQKVGAFKFRGACNAVFSLPEEQRQVVTHSSGNHAQALALAARMRGIAATIVMPRNSSAVKVEAVRGYGGNIVFCEPDLASREATAAKVLSESGGVLIHPYDEFMVICGQGTAAMELVEEVGELDIVLAPVGGGGLISGTLIACAAMIPKASVFGAEPEGADDAMRSLKEGKIVPSVAPRTIADGLRSSLGQLPFAIIRRHISGIVTVSEEAIVRALRLVMERMKIVIEPSSAVPPAALLEKKLDTAGKRIGVILSGGNVDFDSLPFQH